VQVTERIIVVFWKALSIVAPLMLHCIENNSMMKNATNYSLSLCISGACRVFWWPCSLLTFAAWTVLRLSPTKSESSAEMEMGPYWRQLHLERCSDSFCIV